MNDRCAISRSEFDRLLREYTDALMLASVYRDSADYGDYAQKAIVAKLALERAVFGEEP